MMIKRLCIISLSLIALAGTAKKNDNVLSHTITDEAIIFPESFETDTQKLLEGWYMRNYTATDKNYSTRQDVNTTDEEFKQRLAAMPCVIEMPYNQIVRSYIERYTKNGRPQVSALLGLGIYYFPIFEQALEAEGLPLELRYLPVIESSLDPNAVSRSGAAGLWQFILGAAKGYGMEVNSLVDERRDPYTSSKKAALLLKDLYSTYKDWSLAIAAYNCGPGTVNKAIRRAGGDPSKQDFWSIYYYLPQETRGYVPMFIAANYVMNYYSKHNISPVLPTKPLVTDTVGVTDRIHFDQISAVLNIPKDELRVLNPQFRADIIPGSVEKPYYLILPSQQVHAYIMSEPQIKAYQADQYARRMTAEPGGQPDQPAEPTAEQPTEQSMAMTEETFNPADNVPAAEPTPTPAAHGKKHTVIHTVAAGESLADIAAMYEVTPTDIRHLNGLRRNAVRPGQQIKVETAVTTPAKKKTTATATATTQPSAPAQPVTPAASAQKPAAQPTQPAKQTATTTPVPAAKKKTTEQAAPTASPAPTAKKKSTATATPEPAQKGKKGKKEKKQSARPTTHQVQNSENLSTIARKHGVSVEALKKANPGVGDMIHPGDKINIPAKETPSKKASSSKKKTSSATPAKKKSKKKGKR